MTNEEKITKRAQAAITAIAEADDYIIVSVKRDKDGHVTYRSTATNELLVPLFRDYLDIVAENMFGDGDIDYGDDDD